MNPLFLIWSVKIYKSHFLLPFPIFWHIALTSIQLKCTTALCLTLHCHFLCLINFSASQAPASITIHPAPPWVKHSHSNTTEWPNSITYPIYLCWGRLAPWLQCKSLVPVNNLFSNSSKGPPLSFDIRLAEERWIGVWRLENRIEEGESEVVGGDGGWGTRSHPSIQRLVVTVHYRL